MGAKDNACCFLAILSIDDGFISILPLVSMANDNTRRGCFTLFHLPLNFGYLRANVYVSRHNEGKYQRHYKRYTAYGIMLKQADKNTANKNLQILKHGLATYC